jgi:hypothetical protein
MGWRAGGRRVLVLLQLAVDGPQALPQALQGSVATGGDAAAACGQPRQAGKRAASNCHAGKAAHACFTC